MSFLMRRKKVFLFVFLLCLFFGTLNTENIRAQEVFDVKPTENPGGNYDTNKDGKLDAVEQAALAADTAKEKESANSFWSPIINAINNAGLGLISWTVYGISYFLAWLTSLFLNLAAGLFEICLKIGVIDLANILKDKGVRTLWEIFRNIGNIALVFVILYIAITTILQISSEAKKLLGKVIVAAVLMNFSFFFGAIIVDVSNIMALNIYEQVYEAIPDNKEYKINGKKQIGTYIDVKAGAGSVGKNLGVTEDDPTKAGTTIGKEDVQSWANRGLAEAVGLIMLIILDIVLAIILIIAAFSIIGRMVAIILLLLVSPIAFVSMILPSTKKTSSDWWQSIIGQSFYLPLFLLFIYVGIKTIEVISSIELLHPSTKLPKDASLTDSFIYVAPLIVKFSMVIGIFIAALIAANKISSQGSQIVNKIAGSVKSKVAGATIGGAALLGRNTIGRGAESFANSKWGQSMGSTRIGSYALSGLKKTAKSNFDLRGSRAFSGVASATGVGDKVFGSASGKDGFIGQQKRAVERAVARGKSIDLSERDKAEKENADRMMSDMVSLGTENERLEVEKKKEALKTAEASGNAHAIAMAKNMLATQEGILKIQENKIKAQKEYQKLEEKSGAIQKKKDYVEERKRIYTNKIANSWLPANRIASSKILKAKSPNEQLSDIVKKMMEEEKKNNAGTP